ncbi:hypothetical protein BGZ65_000047 [Modicella reniformis]|uniref:Phosphatidylglycerol/phosphatidylinositol transfer protein n=1 Tax=Modicella reniformis TaxID=1440133 RepID=A0A9P6J2V7_9FUNG|nr:hypothetical protein BGZ65_000047 [Modicella reniformis]
MKFFAAIAALAVAAVAKALSPAFSDCSAGVSTDISVTGLTLAPYPLCIGQTVCATITGTLSNPITAGSTLSIIGRYLGRVVYSDNHDLCTVLAASGLPCTVNPPKSTVTACIPVLSSAPASIPVALTIQAVNGNSNLIFCQSATVTAQNCPV